MEVTVNGVPRSLEGLAPSVNLLDALRGWGLTGAKEGCAEGECGACSVLVARPALDGSQRTEWVAVNSCLPPALAYAGQEIVTAEGLGSPADLHPVQEAMAVGGGSQCGYCTPGFVCSMAAEYYRPGRCADEHEQGHDHGPNGFDPHALSGNLCRCTGYRPILDAAHSLGEPGQDDPLLARAARPAPAAQPGSTTVGEHTFIRPADLAEALHVLAAHPDAEPVAGSTDVGVLTNLAMHRPRTIVLIDRLPELRTFSMDDETVEIGAALTLTEVETRLAGRIPLLDVLFPQFASRLIRNGATFGGNLGTGSPIGDAAPALLALDATVVLAHADGRREVALADYFTGYRRSVRRPGELIVAIRMPAPTPGFDAFHKIAKRAMDDISSVAVAYHLGIANGKVERARIGLGGVAATPLRAYATEEALTGAPWSPETIERAAAVLETEGTPMSDHRASERYRRAMLGMSLRKVYAETLAPAGGAR